MKKMFVLLAEFIGHLVIGTVMFLALLGAAAAASYGLTFLATAIGDDWIMYGAAFLKYALFGIDIIVMLIFAVNAAVHFLTETRRALKEPAK